MPFVTIRLVRQVITKDPEAKKSAIAGRVAAAIAAETGLDESEVGIVFEEIEAENWYQGDCSIQKLRFEES